MDYVIRIHDSLQEIPCQAWDALLKAQDAPSPFLRHAYLLGLETSKSAVPETGWIPQFISLWKDNQLVAGCAFYLKNHSYGEYVFDWAWANAYAEHGLAYYPKGLTAVPFTPVPGTRLLAVDAHYRQALLKALLQICQKNDLSSLHLLFISDADRQACDSLGMMQRQTVQIHWHNENFESFDGFLASLSQEKRKKIKQERRRVADAGVSFEISEGNDISAKHWDFFYRCYERTYLEHGNAPYLTRAFFESMQLNMPENWVMFTAIRNGNPIAASLVAVQDLESDYAVSYGRYWGALERVDCLHFEACYYQPIQWCIARNVKRFEGGAQGEHKMARALMPTATYSAHWLAHSAFSDAVARYLEREGHGVDQYLEHLAERNPFKKKPAVEPIN